MSHRISNQSLLRQLAVVVQLGGLDVSSRLFVEVCRKRGQTTGESFFLHFDTLFDYGFLTIASPVSERQDINNNTETGFSDIAHDWDIQFSLTHNGQEFLQRYG